VRDGKPIAHFDAVPRDCAHQKELKLPHHLMRNLAAYLVTIVVFGSAIAALLWQGSSAAVELAPPPPPTGATSSKWGGLPLLLLQLSLIIGFIKLFSSLFRRFGQPRVVVEILAGIALGPSLLGYLSPDLLHFLFPAETRPILATLAQLGLVLFMFVVGLHIDTQRVRQQANAALLISHTAIIFPFFLGVFSALFLYPQFAPPHIHFVPFALFMGIAMSITAFPVLARIISERQLQTTPVGTLALTVAALDDITAWCILALVVAIAQSGPVWQSAITVLLTVLYIVFMFYAVRPFIHWWLAKHYQRHAPDRDKTWMTITILLILLSSLATELIGIHALFGAFLAGVIMPRIDLIRERATERIEYVSELVLLPLFFALVGLHTRIDLLTDWQAWLICGWITTLAIIGKVLGGALAARWANALSWKNAWLLGILLNTRGLMEIIVLTIGLQAGILSNEIYTIMVLMALITTIMTGPLVSLFSGRKQEVSGIFPPPAK
jgi:Kef-type K+ transport system membrane component KefB